MMKSKTGRMPLILAFLGLFFTPSFSSTDLVYDGEVPGRLQTVLASHESTMHYLDAIEFTALSFRMPATIALTRFVSVVDGLKAHSALRALNAATHDNLTFSLLAQGGELCCLGLETFCAAGYWWTGESVFLAGTVVLGACRNAVGLIYY